MRRGLLMLALLMLVTLVGAAPLSGPALKTWTRHLIPLPKQITIDSVRELPLTDLRVRLQPGSSDVEALAAERLAAVVQAKVGGDTPGKLDLILGRCDRAGKVGGVVVPGAASLAKLKNSDQAYAIAAVGGRLYLTGLTEQAVAFAGATMRQLLQAGLQGDKVRVPLVRIVDWPDLSERGEWGGNAPRDTDWLADIKMNLVEAHCTLQVTPEGKGIARMDPEILEKGRLNAVTIVPIIMHLDQIFFSGIYKVFPELKGQGAAAQHASAATSVAPCASNPKFQAIMTDWMVSLAEQKGFSTVCVWLSEEPLRCECAECSKIGQYALETRVCVNAWREAVKHNPNIKLRILLTQGSYSTNDKVLAEVPEGVQVSYYHGGLTYDSTRNPMIYPLLADYAARGRWLGVYPQLNASWRIVCPFSSPQFTHFRMTEFVDKGLACLCAYAPPSNRMYDFNVTAAAEWGWNAHGRDEREFSVAWATVRGLKNPEKAADWAMMLGPVSWDVYGSAVPYSQFFGPAADMIRNRQRPVLGKGLFRYFPDEAHLKRDAAVCEQAMKLARELQAPALIAETQVVGGYVAMLQKLYEIGMLVSRSTPPTDAERLGLQADLKALSEASGQVTRGLSDWEKACNLGNTGGRLDDTADVTEQTVVGVGKALQPFGVRDPGGAFLHRKIGTYEDNDFEQSLTVRKTIEVTGMVLGAGPYQVGFNHLKGWNALNVSRVALASAPKDQPDQLTELVADKHNGYIGYSPKGNVYTLNLPAYDESLRYFLLADIRGTKSSDKPLDRRGCSGQITFWKLRQPGEALPDLPLLPMDPKERARFHGPSFTRGGLRVGVIQGGYGSTSVLDTLAARPGLDVQPIFGYDPAYLKLCQVLVVPQPRMRENLTPEVAALLSRFVQEGGGILTTHDAVGFRGLPVIAPEVCGGGAQNLREGSWQATAQHPLTQGLALNKNLTRSYYDYIVLRPGPQGTVVGRGNPGGAPLLICGQAGKGRYAACGLALGLSTTDDADILPGPDEALLLENAVRWLGGGQ